MVFACPDYTPDQRRSKTPIDGGRRAFVSILLKKIRSILGIVKTTWRCGTSKSSRSLTQSPHISTRFAWQDGQNPRVFQENASTYSARKTGQRIRAARADPVESLRWE